jgi:hypothetical protein
MSAVTKFQVTVSQPLLPTVQLFFSRFLVAQSFFSDLVVFAILVDDYGLFW